MRSLRALRLIQTRSRPSPAIYRGARNLQVIRNGYCSACETPVPPTASEAQAQSTTNPPTPPADHRQLAIEQELFTTSIYSPGSPLFLPNGARMFNKLTNFLREQYERFGFQEVITPTIYKKSLWEKSGHWENYAEDMYSVTGRGASSEKESRQVGEDEEYGLKPMNCPGHCLIFASKNRSYRDLPIRYADFSPLHRNEVSGALSGLTRVRRFHQDDGHIFCRPSQIREEIAKTLEFVQLTYKVLGLGPYRLALSTRPKDHFIGTVEEWDNAESALKASLEASGMEWAVNEGDGAFYGPKIDIILKDSDGKEHQTATVQLDFQLPKRFELEYQAPAPELEQKGLTSEDPELLAVQGPVTPVLIHRAVLGSVERIMALLIEHYNGKWPFWLNPRQIVVITVSNREEVLDFARKTVAYLKSDSGAVGGDLEKLKMGPPFLYYGTPLSIDLDDSDRSLRKKVSEAKRKRYSIIVVVGTENVKSNTLSVDFSSLPNYASLGKSTTVKVNHALNQERLAYEGDGEYQVANDRYQMLQQKGELPTVDPEHLKNFSLNPMNLREILRERLKRFT